MKIVIIAAVVTLSVSVKLPGDFQKCDRKLPDFNECALKAAQDAISKMTKSYSEVNLPSLEPFEVSEARIEGGGGPVAVDQIFRNCKLYGFTGIKFDRFEFDFEKKTLSVSGVIPEIRKECDYQMKGQVLIIPVDGQGNSTIILKQLRIEDILQFEENKKKSKTLMKFVSGQMTMDPALVTFNFQNHRDGTITDNLNPVLNENWKEIFDDVKGGYTELINKILLQILNNFFGKVSMEEAFD